MVGGMTYMNRSWLIVFIGGIFEVIWVVGLKHSFDWWTWLGTAVAIYVSLYFLIRSAKKLPVGTVYAVFTGLGTVGTVAVEILFFGEPFRLIKLLLVLLLLSGVIGLKMITKEPKTEGAEA
jgi:paired small multidrug resistance pump